VKNNVESPRGWPKNDRSYSPGGSGTGSLRAAAVAIKGSLADPYVRMIQLDASLVDLHLRAGQAALRPGFARGVAAPRGVGGRVCGHGEGSTRGHEPGFGGSHWHSPADAYRNAAGRTPHRESPAPQSPGADLRLRPVRTAERALAAIARGRRGA